LAGFTECAEYFAKEAIREEEKAMTVLKIARIVLKSGLIFRTLCILNLEEVAKFSSL